MTRERIEVERGARDGSAADALSRRELLAAVGAASLAACAAPSSGRPEKASEAPRRRPRHVFVLVSDDQSRFDCGCYGNVDVHTPNIDKLAAAGARFERGYAPVGVCKPARSAMYTGLLPHKNGATGFNPVHPDVATWTELLTPQLCATGMIGKLNVKPLEKFVFERWVRPKKVADTRDPHTLRTALSEMLDAFEGRRMALVINLKDPHRPFRGPFDDPDLPDEPVPHDPNALRVPPHLFDTPETRQELAAYYDAIWRLDRNVGGVLEELDARDLARDSLVLFVSDNGQPFPFAKTTLYEAGLNLPFLARWPGVLAPGSVRSEFVSLIDILPTAVDAFEARAPSHFDGRSLLPLLSGEPYEPHPFVVGEHTEHLVGEPTPSRSLREERFKYILNIAPDENFANNVLDHSLTWRSWIKAAKSDDALRERMRRLVNRPPEELYDLEADPYELVNLAESADHASRLEAMRGRLADWMRREGDPYAKV